MTIEKNKEDNVLKRLLHSQMIIPIAALLALVVFRTAPGTRSSRAS